MITKIGYEKPLMNLNSLTLVNKLMQKKVLAYTTHKSSRKTDQDPSDRTGDPVEYNGWLLITKKSQTWDKDRSAKFNQLIKITKRYSTLSGVLNGDEGMAAVFTNGVKNKVKNVSRRKTTENGVTRKKIKKKKVIVNGDSHARGLAVELSVSLGKSFEVMGTIMPGSRLSHMWWS
jgi:hypothetical protein